MGRNKRDLLFQHGDIYYGWLRQSQSCWRWRKFCSFNRGDVWIYFFCSDDWSYLRPLCEANILFVLGEMQKRQPNADYDHLTLVGHSNGGDVSMYVAKQHPELVSKVITLDNLRVPFVLSDRMKILSFRSKDPNFKTDPGVLPAPAKGKSGDIDIVDTGALHTDLSDRGPQSVKAKIQMTLDRFLRDSAASDLAPANTEQPMIANPGDY